MKFAPLSGGNGCSLLSAVLCGPTSRPPTHRNRVRGVGLSGGRGIGRAGSGRGVHHADPGAPAGGRREVQRLVVVEWLNVSSGNDTPSEYTYVAPELVRGGYVWVRVSAQFVGVEGGSGSVGIGGDSLATKDPDRYGSLHHPGDAYCHIHVRRHCRRSAHRHPAVRFVRREGAGDRRVAVRGSDHLRQHLCRPARHLRRVSDSFARAGRSAVGSGGRCRRYRRDLPGRADSIDGSVPVPVFTVQTETDLLTDFRFHLARQRDSGTVRTWEVAGSAHADCMCTHCIQ